MALGHYIPRNKRSNLSKYKYSSADHSIVSRYVLSPYWNKLVTLFPKSVAPNTITLMGLGFVIVNFLTLLALEPTLSCASKPLLKSLGGSWDPLFPPSQYNGHITGNWLDKAKGYIGVRIHDDAVCPSNWVFASFAIGLWLYQSFDAIDGKQARRTGTSGPLGELFDHGCDALNTTLECILAAAALNLGQGWWTVASQVATLANFYLTTWEEWHTGTLYLSVFSGPVEGILIIVAIFAISSIYGPGFWDQGLLTVLRLDRWEFVNNLPIKNLPLNECFLLFGAAGLVFNISSSYMNVMKARRKQGQDVVTPALGLLPFVVTTALHVFWLSACPALLHTHLVPFMIYWGFSFAYTVGLLIVSHVLQSTELFPWWHVLMIWSALGSVDANLETLSGGRFEPIIQSSEANMVTFVWVSVAVSFAVYAYFVTDIILDVCDYCDINCLTIKYKDGKKEADSSGTATGRSVAADGNTRRRR